MVEVGAPRGTPEPVVPHLGATARKDVLQEAVEKLDAGHEGAPGSLRAVVAIPKRDPVVIDLLEPTGTDRDAEEIPRQVVEHPCTIAGRLRVHDPWRRPHRR